MRVELLGLDLNEACEILHKQGIEPIVTLTRSPKQCERTDAVLRVIYASDDCRNITVAEFLDPIDNN